MQQSKQAPTNFSIREKIELQNLSDIFAKESGAQERAFLDVYKQAQEQLLEYNQQFARLEELPMQISLAQFQPQRFADELTLAANQKNVNAISSTLTNRIQDINIEQIVANEPDFLTQLALLAENRYQLETAKQLVDQRIREAQEVVLNRSLNNLKMEITNKLAQLDRINIIRRVEELSFVRSVSYKVADFINNILGKIRSVGQDINQAVSLIKNMWKTNKNFNQLAQLQTDVNATTASMAREIQELEKLEPNRYPRKTAALRQLKETISVCRDLLQTNVAQALDSVGNLKASLDATAARYKANELTLFETMRETLNDQINAVEEGYPIDKIYEIIGLDADQRFTLQPEEIKQAVNTAITQAAARNDLILLSKIALAEKLLTNPEWRANYDAFLNDWRLLQQRHTQQAQSLAITRITETMRDTLTGGSGSLNKIEIQENVF